MLAAAGGKVVIADMQAEKGQAVAQAIGGVFVRCDVTSEADGQAVIAQATALGKLMGLVNCAGVAPAEKIVGKNGAHSLANFSKTISINLIGSFNMMRLAAEAMGKNEPESTGERGVLISTASVAAATTGKLARPPTPPPKGGIVGMTLPSPVTWLQRHSQDDDRPRHFWHADAVWYAPGSGQDALAAGVPFPQPFG